jgi:hypothetical protein
MPNSISEQFFAAGQKLINSSAGRIGEALNSSLNELLSDSFRAGPGSLIDPHSHVTGPFPTVVRGKSNSSSGHALEVPNEEAACVIDVHESLDLERLRLAYARIAEAKKLKKPEITPIRGVDRTTVTLGIIFAREAAVPLEALAEELQRLNAATPSRQWAEMVVILSKGVINYGVQFPGDGGIAGDLLPQAVGALSSPSPPIYVIMLIHATEKYSFNKLCSYLVAHLGLFCPGAKLPFFKDVLEGTPTTAITLCGYQYNVGGDLLAVPRQFYNDRYLPPFPMLIEDGQGNLLSTVQFVPWQDGGVVILKGKLPLQGLLIFLGVAGLRYGGSVKRNDLQISNVLPINWVNFIGMLQQFQRQSNMVVKDSAVPMIVQKLADEGTTSPFIARVFYGPLRFRDQTRLDQSKRLEFDAAYNFVMTELMNARTTAHQIRETLENHMRKIAQRTIARVNGNTLHINENIDLQLGKQVEDFINGIVRSLKHGMQSLTKILGADIGFLFQKTDAFWNGLGGMQSSDPFLADYIKQCRPWSERLMECRNAIEHKGWKLAKIKYSGAGGTVRAEEPEVAGEKLTAFVTYTLDRVICLVEDVTLHCLKAHMPPGISMTEINKSDRDSEIPLRFQITPASGGMPVWHIRYHQSSFEDT